MSAAIPRAQLERCRAWIAERWGLQFEAAREKDLQRGLIRAAQELNCDAETLARQIGDGMATHAQQEIIIAHLTVGETYFWRDKAGWQALQETILPALIAQRRTEKQLQLRLWSAACCSGEEAYSLAILLHQLLPDFARWQVFIAATDLNPQFLDKARAATYSAWSFRAAPPGFRERYFEADGPKHWRLKADIVRTVNFFPLNLVAALDARLQNLDVILCRNVLIYFSEAQRQSTVGHFYDVLRPGGWLAVGPSETSQTLFARFETVNFPGTVWYQKPPTSTCSSFSMPFLSQNTPASTCTVYQTPFVSENAAASTCSIDEASFLPKNTPASTCSAVETARDWAQRARQLADAGDLEAARQCCEKALGNDKMRAETYCLYAAILQEQNQLSEAANALRRALYLNHDCIAAHFALGQLAQRNDNLHDAARHFANARQLLQQAPNEAIVPESGGLSAAELLALLDALS